MTDFKTKIAGGKRKVNKSLKAWVAFVKKVQKEEKLSYKDAIHRAKVRKDKGEKWMKGGNYNEENLELQGQYDQEDSQGNEYSGDMNGDDMNSDDMNGDDMNGGRRRRRRRTMRRSRGRRRGRTARRSRRRSSRRY